ncbi:DUF3857 domain-containing protein [Salinimicrobium catena]|uniref:DUF3857 domain-containing protein n=1 Tax=Salinimicrobium catena TaxID=390640 RepID=UPI002FE4A829
MRKISFLVLLGFFTSLLTAQERSYPVSTIDNSLFENANAIIRNDEIEIEVTAINKMFIRTERTVTVLNELGEELIWAGEVYDDDIKIKKQEAVIIDQDGNEIKKFKKKDFQDRSLVTGATLISDARISYIDYSPKVYPFTVQYISEVQAESTIFIKDWFPVNSYSLSVEKSIYTLRNPAKIPIRFLEKNLSSHKIEKFTSEFELEYLVEHLPAYKFEKFSPGIKEFAPLVKVALNQFSLVGVKGQAENWTQLGKWQYDNLLDKKMELSPETVRKVKDLTENATDVREKIKLIYNYVQENTRYVSVQLGIGGWEPMSADEVDHLKYGDCKGLTNYTKALLASQNIPSYYAVVYGGRELKDIDEEFASMEGNHVILNVPYERENIWLECTSQTSPFNYLGGFTDNRKVLLIKSDGGEIMETTKYTPSDNLTETKISVTIDETGNFNAQLHRESFGVPYGLIYPVSDLDRSSKELYYKKEFGHLKNLKIKEINHTNDYLHPKFLEDLKVSGSKYGSVLGKRLLLPLNFTNLPALNLPRSSNRERQVEINRGFSYKDHFQFILPGSSILEFIPNNTIIENEFGSFRIEIEYAQVDGQNMLIVERSYVLQDGKWPAKKYEELRDFMLNINSLSNQKAVIVLTD